MKFKIGDKVLPRHRTKDLEGVCYGIITGKVLRVTKVKWYIKLFHTEAIVPYSDYSYFSDEHIEQSLVLCTPRPNHPLTKIFK